MKTESPHTQQPAPVTTTNGHSHPARGPVIHIPTEEERSAVLEEFFGAERKRAEEGRAAVALARPALERLCEVLRGRSGQPFKLRALLYSLYNGQAASLLEIVCLDWQIRQDLCAVLLAFSFEDPNDEANSFYYAELKAAITKAGQWDWFIACDEESEAAK